MHWTERLSDYLDDALTPEERTACDAHLAACASCRQTANELRTLIAAAQVEAMAEPPHDLWPGIAARISPREREHRVVAFASGAERALDARRMVRDDTVRRVSFTLPQLALAASLLVAVSSAVAYVAAGRGVPAPGAIETPIVAQAEQPFAVVADVERANLADAAYDEAIGDLEAMLVTMRDELDPRTVRVIERNLATIDQAIREARQALDADPANTFLNSHLIDARRKKLELLRRATMIAAGD